MDKILILDFGSQYTQLIARRVRELGVYCEIHPFSLPLDEVKAFGPKGIILSGSPASVYQPNAPLCDREVIEQGAPTSLDEVYWPCSHSRAMPSFPSQIEWKIGLAGANTRGILNSPCRCAMAGISQPTE